MNLVTSNPHTSLQLPKGKGFYKTAYCSTYTSYIFRNIVDNHTIFSIRIELATLLHRGEKSFNSADISERYIESLTFFT